MYLNFSNFRGQTSAGGGTSLGPKTGTSVGWGEIGEIFAGWGDPQAPQEKNPAPIFTYKLLKIHIPTHSPWSCHLCVSFECYILNVICFYSLLLILNSVELTDVCSKVWLANSCLTMCFYGRETFKSLDMKHVAHYTLVCSYVHWVHIMISNN